MISLPADIKAEIERVYGRPVKYPADCHRLALSLRESINETIGVTTLKRLFGFVSDVKEPRQSTLDLLARYCGYTDYKAMLSVLAAGGDSDFEKADGIMAEVLNIGARVSFEYMPDRLVKVIYLGNSRFEVIESRNGSLKPGDIITTAGFCVNFPLVVSNVARKGESLGRYVAGKVSGLTSLHLEEPPLSDC